MTQLYGKLLLGTSTSAVESLVQLLAALYFLPMHPGGSAHSSPFSATCVGNQVEFLFLSPRFGLAKSHDVRSVSPLLLSLSNK